MTTEALTTAVVLVLFLTLWALPGPEEIDPFCKLSRAWKCRDNCSLGCDVCGATCDTQSAHITFIDIDNTYLTTLPENIGNLRALTWLSLRNNFVETLPSSFANLTNLQKLVMGPGGLTAIPEYFGNFSHLTHLDLQQTRIQKLPESFGSLVQLTHLSLSATYIRSFPIVLRRLHNLQFLGLMENYIPSIVDEDIANLTQLGALVIDRNELTTLPQSLGNLSQLVILTMAENYLTALPNSIGKLSKLAMLTVVGNELTWLPTSFGNLPKMKLMLIYANYLNCKNLSIKGENVEDVEIACNSTRQLTCNEQLKQKCESTMICRWDERLSMCLQGSRCLDYGPTHQCLTCDVGFGLDAGTNGCKDCADLKDYFFVYWSNGTLPCTKCGSILCRNCDQRTGKCLKCFLNGRRPDGTCSWTNVGLVIAGGVFALFVLPIASCAVMCHRRRKQKQNYEPLRVLLVTGEHDPRVALEGLENCDIDDRALGVTVSPTTLTFGSTRGQLAVGETANDMLKLTIAGPSKSVKYRILLPDDVAHRFTIGVQSMEGTIVAKNGPTTVELTLSLLCTTRLTTSLYVIINEKRFTEVPVVAESMLSTKLDASELELSTILGSGAFGSVYRAIWRGAVVAVKSYNESVLVDEILRNDIEREVSMCTALRHNNVVSFFGSAQTPDKFFIIMELVEFGSLGSAVKKGPLPLDFKVRVALDIARGMDFLHRSHIIHRDLKTDNVLVASFDPAAQVCGKLSDFNTSKFIGSDANRTKTKGIGTPVYMAPEILNGAKYEYAADVYSFGIILWNLWTQQEPYAEFEDQFAIYNFVNSGSRLPIPDDVPEPLKALTTAAWDPEPAKRPNFQRISEDLSAFTAAQSK